MGDILDRIVTQIEEADVYHDWTKKVDRSGDGARQYYGNIVDQIQHPFLQDGFKLIKQQYPYKGIRYGGESSLDKKFSIPSAIGLIISEATIDKSQEALDLLISETWYRNNDVDAIGGSTQVNGSGSPMDITNGNVITADQLKTLLSMIKNGDLLLQYADQISQSAKRWNINPIFSLAMSVHETGWWTSSIFKNANNVGGLMQNSKKYAQSGTASTGEYYSGRNWAKFNTPGDSFNAKMWLLRTNYIDAGLTTMVDILNKYAPPTDNNDVSNYVSVVGKLMKDFLLKLSIDPDVEIVSTSLNGSTTSKIAWTPGQELNTPVGYFSAMNSSAYGVPKGKSGQEWMKGDGTSGIHLEMDSAIKGCHAAMQKETGMVPQSYSGFRSRASQQELYNNHLNPNHPQYHVDTAPPGDSAHGCGYALDYSPTAPSPQKEWMKINGLRFGLVNYNKERWHYQLHPDLAYILAQKNAARGGTWD